MAVALEVTGVGVFYLTGPLDEWTGEEPAPAGVPVVTRAEIACLRASGLGKDREMARAILLVKTTFPGAMIVRVRTRKRTRDRWYDVEA